MTSTERRALKEFASQLGATIGYGPAKVYYLWQGSGRDREPLCSISEDDARDIEEAIAAYFSGHQNYPEAREDYEQARVGGPKQ